MVLRVCMRRLLQGPQAHPKNWIGGVLPDVSGGQTAARLLSGRESARGIKSPPSTTAGAAVRSARTVLGAGTEVPRQQAERSVRAAGTASAARWLGANSY